MRSGLLLLSHLSPRLCPSTAECNLTSMPSIVLCLFLSCSRWFPPSFSCCLAIIYLVVPLISSISLVVSVQRLVHLLSFILAICPAYLHFCFSVYSIMSIIVSLIIVYIIYHNYNIYYVATAVPMSTKYIPMISMVTDSHCDLQAAMFSTVTVKICLIIHNRYFCLMIFIFLCLLGLRKASLTY